MSERRWSGKALTPSEHEAINARHYPGTRQLCVLCDQPTGRCEDDSIFVGDVGPLCEECHHTASADAERLEGTDRE